MVSITLGVVVAALIGFVIARFALPRVQSKGDLGKLSLMTTGLSLALLALAAASCNVKTYNSAAVSAEPVQTLDAFAASFGSDVLVEGTISQDQSTGLANDYVAYLRWSGLSSDPSPDDIEYELPDLLLDFESAASVTVDRLIYNDINWPETNLTNETYRHLRRGDKVVVYGEAYESLGHGPNGTSKTWRVASPFVFFGDYAAYSAEYAPTLQRTAFYAQIVQYVSVALACVILLTPLPQLTRFRETAPASD